MKGELTFVIYSIVIFFMTVGMEDCMKVCLETLCKCKRTPKNEETLTPRELRLISRQLKKSQ